MHYFDDDSSDNNVLANQALGHELNPYRIKRLTFIVLNSFIGIIINKIISHK